MSEREPFEPGDLEQGGHPHDGTLWAFVADGLDGQEADAVAAHLAGCDACTEAVAAFGEVADTLHAVHEAPSEIARVRGRRRLEAALQQEVVIARRRAVKGPRVLLVAAVAAFAGAAVATVATVDPVRAWFTGRDAPAARSVERAALEREVPAPAPVMPRVEVQAQQRPAAEPITVEPVATRPMATDPDAVEPVAVAAEPAAAEATPEPTRQASTASPRASGKAPVVAPPAAAAGPRVARAAGTPSPQEAYEAAAAQMRAAPAGDAGWLGVGDLAAMAGKPEGAAEAYAEALKGGRAKVAGERLEKLVQAGAIAPDAALGLVARRGGDGAEALRVLCAWGLRYRGDRPAVSVCQSFGRQFPQHPSARSLALSAGRTAEFKLNDLALAEEEYSRAILVSQYAGTPGTSALFARARCRMKRKNLDEARADLRLFLHVQPEARWRDDVKVLAADLGVTLLEAPSPGR
jgi:tetratricopeptide (TPR) repeat protein